MKRLPKLRKEHISACQWRNNARQVVPGGHIPSRNLRRSFSSFIHEKAK
jgi:hypothetical protein